MKRVGLVACIIMHVHDCRSNILSHGFIIFADNCLMNLKKVAVVTYLKTKLLLVIYRLRDINRVTSSNVANDRPLCTVAH